MNFSEKFPVAAVYDCTDIYSVLKVLAKISQENFQKCLILTAIIECIGRYY